MKWLLITLMLASVCGFAQPRATQKKQAPAARPAGPPAGRWPIESITVEGNHSYTRDQVIETAGLKIGQMAGRPEFEAARDRLVASGAFETVGYKFVPGSGGQGYVATFQVAEVQQVYPVDFEDLHVSSRDLEAALKAKEPLYAAGRLPATQPVLERYAKFVQDYLAAKGIEEKIAAAVAPGEPGDYAIVFRPARVLPAVAQVTFEGNQVVPQNVLREAVAGVAIGAPYTEDTFRQLLSASIRPVYEARGRVRISFPQIRTEPVKDVQGIHVFVTIDEGQSYELGKVAVEGPSPVNPNELLKAGDFKAGDVANMDRVNEGLERIRKAMRHAGYMEAKVTQERRIDDAKKAVDVAIHVDAGPQFTMGKLNLVGLDLEGEVEIRRIWTIKAGQAFNPDYPDLFLKRIRDQGVFDGLGETKSDIHLNAQAHTADVTLTFKGAKPPTRHRRGGV
jgi:outer membrane protein insertion porin family